jgi:hypothetical protein
VQIVHDEVGAVGHERIAVAAAIDADHETKATAAAGLYARDRILDDHGSAGCHAEQDCRPKERIRMRLPFERQDRGIDAIDTHVE